MMKVFPSQVNWNGLFFWILQTVYLWYLASPWSVWRLPGLSGTVCSSCIPVLSYTLHQLPSSALAYAGLQWIFFMLQFYIPACLSSSFPISLFCFQPPHKDIVNDILHPLPNETNFQQLFCTSNPRTFFYFLEPSAINLRQILSFFTHSFQSAFFLKSCKHPFELLYPKMTLLDKPRRKTKISFLITSILLKLLKNNSSEGKAPKIILWGHHYPDCKIRQRSYIIKA